MAAHFIQIVGSPCGSLIFKHGHLSAGPKGSAQRLVENSFNPFIDELPWEVFRIKGPVQFADRVELLNFVGGKSDWLPWEGESQTQLVFIGWDIDPDEILKKAALCITYQ